MQTGQPTRRALHAVPSPAELPREWGNPLWYYWTEPYNLYYCRLCWKYATDTHVTSTGHHKAKWNWKDRLEYWPSDPPTGGSANGISQGLEACAMRNPCARHE